MGIEQREGIAPCHIHRVTRSNLNGGLWCSSSLSAPLLWRLARFFYYWETAHFSTRPFALGLSSASSSHFTAGAFGFLIFTQYGERSEREGVLSASKENRCLRAVPSESDQAPH